MLLFTCGENKICSSIKMSQNIMNIVVDWLKEVRSYVMEVQADFLELIQYSIVFWFLTMQDISSTLATHVWQPYRKTVVLYVSCVLCLSERFVLHASASCNYQKQNATTNEIMKWDEWMKWNEWNVFFFM